MTRRQPEPNQDRPISLNGRKKSAEGLNTLDSPDDGEIFDTGDASDFAGKSMNRNRGRKQHPNGKESSK